MRMFLSVVLAGLLVGACAPVHFSKPSSPNPPPPEPSIFEQYLRDEVPREHVIAWIFRNIGSFRGAIYDIRVEIANQSQNGPISQARESYILALEYELNQMIDRYNDRALLARVGDFGGVLFEKAWRNFEGSASVSPVALRERGLDARVISNSSSGMISSSIRNGVQIEKVDLLCRASCNLSDFATGL